MDRKTVPGVDEALVHAWFIIAIKRERAKGLEPSTASLEGWRSAIELRPREQPLSRKGLQSLVLTFGRTFSRANRQISDPTYNSGHDHQRQETRTTPATVSHLLGRAHPRSLPLS